MENQLICLDTTVLIDFFRKTKKENSFFYSLTKKYDSFAVSVITEFEIFNGSNEKQQSFWENFFKQLTILPFDQTANQEAILIFKDLRKRNKMIDMPDLFIGATAKARQMKLATLNVKHFERIEGLELITRD